LTSVHGRGRHVGPDGEGNDGQAREKEVGERRRLCHHGDERDRERDDRDQAAKRVGLEPPLAGLGSHMADCSPALQLPTSSCERRQALRPQTDPLSWRGGPWFLLFRWSGSLLVGAWFLFRRGEKRGRTHSAEEILGERYARGEITVDEYRQRGEVLRGGGWAPVVGPAERRGRSSESATSLPSEGGSGLFAYSEDVTERYPTIRAGVIRATGLSNGPSSPELLAAYRAEQRVASERLDSTAIADFPSIAAWRRAFAGFGAKPTQYRSAAEALLRRLAKQGDIPSISTLVDIGNHVSIRYAVPVAVFDRAGVAGSITVRFATGDERFTDLGSSESVTPGRSRRSS